MAENNTHMVSEQEVLLISKLASIDLRPNEVESFRTELSNILGFINQLAEVNTSGEDGNGDEALQSRLRPDVVTDGGYRDELLANAPSARHGYFVVPKVIE